jgi:hypothetical protein
MSLFTLTLFLFLFVAAAIAVDALTGAQAMTARLPFTEAAVRRAISAARKAGLPIVATEVTPDGTVRLIHEALAPSVTPINNAATSKWADADG